MNCLFRKSLCYFYIVLSIFVCAAQVPLAADCHRDIVADRIKARRIKAGKIVTRNEKIKNKLTVKKVDNNIGDIYVVGTDIATIQEGINLASSGLKPEAASKSSTNPGAKNVTIQIPAGTYHESLFIDTTLSDPAINDPGTDLLMTQGRGLRLEGDPRPIAAMTYMQGGQVMTDSSYVQDSGLNSLGTLGSVVSLTNSGNTLTVTNTPGTDPNFTACGVVAGDVIIVTDNDGTMQQRTVISVSLNSVTYDSTPVTLSGNGAALTFCPNVQIEASIADYSCYILGGAVEISGVWFSMDPALYANSVYGVWVEGTGELYTNRTLFDARNLFYQGALGNSSGGQILVSLADNDVLGHVSCLAGDLETANYSNVYGGNWYFMAGPGQYDCLLQFGDTSLTFINSVQINGAGNAVGHFIYVDADSEIRFFNAFNCAVGVSVNTDCNALIEGPVNIENCGIGASISGGRLQFDPAYFPLLPSHRFSDCPLAIQVYNSGQFTTEGPIVVVSSNPGTTGIELTCGATFTSSDNVNFTNITYPYAIDNTSRYLTPFNVLGTDPSLDNLFTYTFAGAQTMNSAYLDQLLDNAGVIQLSLDPSLAAPDGTKIYRGKEYTLTKVSGGSHTLTLTGTATFLGGGNTRTFSGPAGSTLTIRIISDTQVAIVTSTGVS